MSRADSLLSWNPLYRLPRAVVLDTMFGPAEDFEYECVTVAPDAQAIGE